MKKLRFLLSLTNDDNDYQIEQTSAARQAASKLGVELQIVYAGNDGIVQSQQLLSSIHSTNAPRPDAVIFEPAGSTAHPQVARAAAAAGIGVVSAESEADYIAELRRRFSCAGVYHYFKPRRNRPHPGTATGRAAARRRKSFSTFKAHPKVRLPNNATPECSKPSPRSVQLRVLKAHWTEASAHKTVGSWLRLSTSRQAQIEAVCAQDDSMAMGARKAFEECS